MKLIEAMKKSKDLNRKASDLRDKIAKFSSDYSHETPTYGSEDKQRTQIAEWLQAHHDILATIRVLREAVQRTNIVTKVKITLGGVPVEHSIAGWIHRRRDLAGFDHDAYKALTGGNKQRYAIYKDDKGVETPTQLRRYFDPRVKDLKMEVFRSEPSEIDSTLEVVNAVTDLVD